MSYRLIAARAGAPGAVNTASFTAHSSSQCRIRTPLIGALIAFVMLLGATASAQNPPQARSNVAGFWRFLETDEMLEFYACGAQVCARLAALAPGERQTRDDRNPNDNERGRPLCGLTVIRNLQHRDQDSWRRGEAYSPEDGRSYDVSIELRPGGLMAMRASLPGFPLLASNYLLERSDAPRPCSG